MTVEYAAFDDIDEFGETEYDDDLNDLEGMFDDLESYDDDDDEFIGPLLIGKAASSLFGKSKRPRTPRPTIPSGRLGYNQGTAGAMQVANARIAADIKKLSRTAAQNHSRSVANERRSKANSTAAKRLRTVSNRQTKQIKAVGDRVGQIQQTSLITTLLASGGRKKFEIESVDDDNAAPDGRGAIVEVKEKGDSLGLLLPLMLSGGLGGGSGSGGGGLFENPLTLILLMKALDDDD